MDLKDFNLTDYLRDLELRRSNRRRHMEEGFKTFYDVSLAAARRAGDSPALGRLESVVRSQWRFGEMVRAQLEQVLPKLLDVLITDNHTDLTALYTLLYGCCSQAHSDSAALLSALNSFSVQAHSDAQSVLSSLAGLQSALASINDALVSGFSGMESSLSAVAENTAAVASNTQRPAFVLSVWPADVELAAGNGLTLSYHFSGAVATVIVGAMLDDSVVLPVNESAQTVWCPPFDTPGSFEVFVRATDGLSEALAKSRVTVTESVPDITASFNISPGSGTAPAPVSGPSPLSVTFPGGSGFSWQGYDFLGWVIAAPGPEVHLPGSQTAVYVDTVFHAAWESSVPPSPPEPVECTVEWHLEFTGSVIRISSGVLEGAGNFDLLFGSSGVSVIPQVGFEVEFDRVDSGNTVALLHCPAAGSSGTVDGVQRVLSVARYMENPPSTTVTAEKTYESPDFPYSVYWKFRKV